MGKTCCIAGCKKVAERKYCEDHSQGRSSPLHRHICTVRRRAKEAGMVFELSPEDFIRMVSETPTCPILGIKLEYGGERDNSPSLDRIDNSRGYSKDNVHIISGKANRMKNDATKEELRLFALWVQNNDLLGQ